jgi:hypothetical protein
LAGSWLTISKRYIELVYAATAWGLVFMDRSRAENLADLHCALKAKTWGEFRRLAGNVMYQEVVSTLEDNGAWNLGTYYEEHRCEDGATLDSIVERFKGLPVGKRIPENDDKFSDDQIPSLLRGLLARAGFAENAILGS